MTLPNFLIIGAQKSGTTSLCRHLASHPSVYIPAKKEPHFFSYEGREPVFRRHSKKTKNVINTLPEYRALFDGVSGESAVGEGSTSYLHEEQSAGRIHHYAPEARLIAILREPVDRAWSHFHHSVRSGREPVGGFARAIHEEERRLAEGWGDPYAYKKKGFYAQQLRRYLEVFPREQLHVCLFDDLLNDPKSLLRKVFEFLGVDPDFEPDLSRKYNVGGDADEVFDYRGGGIADRIRTALSPARRNRDASKKPPFPDDLRSELKELYRPEIEDLQELIGRDLSEWL